MGPVTLPHDWYWRVYQLPSVLHMWSGHGVARKRVVDVWHRRAGKDSSWMNFSAVEALEKVGTYWHMYPTAAHGRRALWNGIDHRRGRRFIDQAFPQAIRAAEPNETEMRISLAGGSQWYIVGSDNFDSLIGGNPIGIVFSEWSVANPRAWDYLSPMLLENGGWAAFIYTPRGWNHAKDLYEIAKASRDPNWHTELLTVDDTGVITPQQLDSERASGRPEEYIQQEYYCSFDAPNEGSYWGREMIIAEKEGRITEVPWNPALPVVTSWDIGRRDANGIWFFQLTGLRVHAIDYEEDTGKGLPHYAKIVKEKPYVYSEHIAGHDIKVNEWGSDESRISMAKKLGIKFKPAPQLSHQDYISAVHAAIPRTYFDRNRCRKGLDALRHYGRAYDEDAKRYLDEPLHDWSEAGASAFKYFAVTKKSTLLRRLPSEATGQDDAPANPSRDWMSV